MPEYYDDLWCVEKRLYTVRFNNIRTDTGRSPQRTFQTAESRNRRSLQANGLDQGMGQRAEKHRQERQGIQSACTGVHRNAGSIPGQPVSQNSISKTASVKTPDNAKTNINATPTKILVSSHSVSSGQVHHRIRQDDRYDGKDRYFGGYLLSRARGSVDVRPPCS